MASPDRPQDRHSEEARHGEDQRPPGDGKLNPSTVSSLYFEYAEPLRRFVFGLVRDHQLTGDVLQLTFVKLLEQGHTARDETRKGWLFRVAYHQAMLIRRRDAVGDRVLRRLAWGRPNQGQPADAALVRAEVVEAVREAVAALPAAQSQVVRMRMVEEKTFAEIAAQLKIPLGTALSRMRSALAKLRESLPLDPRS